MAASSSTEINTSVNQFVEDESIKIVVFHLDTTDWDSKVAEICQIAARYEGNQFQEYLIPSGPFNERATKSNRFAFRNGKLTQAGRDVNAVSPSDGLKNFLDFLSDLTGNTGAVLLAANNCYKFQRHVLVRIMKKYNLLDTFESLVQGFIDTVPVFKKILPNEDCSLENLAKYTPYALIFYDAVVYVDIIVSLIDAKNCSDETLKQNATKLDEFIRYFDLNSNFEMVQNEIEADNLTDDNRWKLARAGITIDMLKNAYREDPEEGISNLLKAKLKMQQKTITKINKNVKKLCDNDNNIVQN
ncbi:hypothetical protein PYW07_002710 [Mythimna separata]|uniref:Uncharacterized protein n=1 Tax=Mythimna separata TaxID=271217 RepID=A0AAD7YFT7_MYTSE|nr:hypothetical protein PYW07_002710 [Mythimna separata]